MVKEKSMSEPLKYPKWQTPLVDAILEFNSERLSEKVLKLDRVIHNRLDAVSGSHDFREREALTDALATLEILKGNVESLQHKDL
jgi:hypothetical protein